MQALTLVSPVRLPYPTTGPLRLWLNDEHPRKADKTCRVPRGTALPSRLEDLLESPQSGKGGKRMLGWVSKEMTCQDGTVSRQRIGQSTAATPSVDLGGVHVYTVG